MANVVNSSVDQDGNIIYDVTANEQDVMTLATAGTYVDKNIVFNLNVVTSSGGGIDTTDATATADDIKIGKTAYGSQGLIVGTHEEREFLTEEKVVTPTESIQHITPTDTDGLSMVIVNPINSTYIGSAIAKDPLPIINSNNITIPSGYYSTQTEHSIALGQLGNVIAEKGNVSNNSIVVSSSISGCIEGYITETQKSGTSVTINASELVSGNKELSATEQLQTNIDITNYATASISAIDSNYIGSSILKKNAEIYTPSAQDQIISSNQYLNGDQTIKGDVNLIPENIANGVSIFGIIGTHTGTNQDNQRYYTGESTPEATLGEDGDIYFKISTTTIVGEEIGHINEDGTIVFNNTLQTGVYTLIYEDSSGNKLDNWVNIGTHNITG